MFLEFVILVVAAMIFIHPVFVYSKIFRVVCEGAYKPYWFILLESSGRGAGSTFTFSIPDKG